MTSDIKYTVEFVNSSGLFSPSAIVMGNFLLRYVPECVSELYLAMVLTIDAGLEQNICCRLDEYSGKTLTANDNKTTLQLPEYSSWRKILADKKFQNVIAVLDDDRLPVDGVLMVLDLCGGCYLQRQWSFECSIVRNLLSRAAGFRDLPDLPPGRLHGLVGFFKTAADHPAVDYQQFAVLTALRRKLTVISGGPGTGKTTVAAAVLALKLEQQPGLRILLAAPTAKAAVQLKKSLNVTAENLHCDKSIVSEILALECSTLHRLLGSKRKSHEFKYNLLNKLECDLLLVDECSMVSLDMMARLLEALPEDADLILLGDRFQLASVDAGSVMADICASAKSNCADWVTADFFERQTSWKIPVVTEAELQKMPLNGCLIELLENHRISRNAPIIGEISDRIRNIVPGDDVTVLAREIMLKNGDEFKFVSAEPKHLTQIISSCLHRRMECGASFCDLPRLAAGGNADDRGIAFKLLDSLKILAPGYDGVFGCKNLNNICMKILNLQSVDDVGMPLMILENDYRTGLFNGDIGLVALDEYGEKKVFFEDKDLPCFDLGDIPAHEPVFAMSVHKSQGSGFDEVILVIAGNNPKLLSREMLYTGITRTRKHLCCVSDQNSLCMALGCETKRASNLTARLIKQNQ